MKRIASPLHIPAPKKRITTQLLKLPKKHFPPGQPPEDLIYANKAEQRMLKMMGGSGKMTKQGVKSFYGDPTNTDSGTRAGSSVGSSSHGSDPTNTSSGTRAGSSAGSGQSSTGSGGSGYHAGSSGSSPGAGSTGNTQNNSGSKSGSNAGSGGHGSDPTNTDSGSRAGSPSGGSPSGSNAGSGGKGSDPTNTPSGNRAGSGGNQPTSPSGTGGGGGGGMGTSAPSNPATSPSTGGTNTMQSVDQKLSTPTTPDYGSGAPTPTAPTTPGVNDTLAGMLSRGDITPQVPKTSLPASNSLMGSISPTLSEAYRGLQSMFSGQVPAKPTIGSQDDFRAPTVASQLANPTVTPTSAAPPTSDIMGGVPPSQMTPEQRLANAEAVRRKDVQSPRQLNISGVANYLNTPGALADPAYTKQLVDASLAGERMFNIKGATPEQQALADQISHAALLSAGPAGVDPRTIMGQALTESTTSKNPTKVSSLADKYNNLFGMKAAGPVGADWTGQKVSLPTKEMINGKMVTVPQNFKVYDNPMQSVYDYGRLMQTDRYAKPLAGKEGVPAEIGAIRGAGYATHPADAYTKMVADRAASITTGGGLPSASPPTQIASNQPTVQPANTPPPTTTPGINFGLAGMLGSGIYNAVTNPTGVGQSITNAINQGMKGFKTASAAIDKYGGPTWAPKLAAMAGPDKLGIPSIIGGLKDATNSFMNSLKNPQAPSNLHSSPTSDTVQKAAPTAASKIAAASPTTGIQPSTATPTAAEVLAAKKLNDAVLKPPTASTPLSTIKSTVVATAKVAAVVANPIAGLSVLGAKKLYDVIQADRANMQYLKDNYPDTYAKEMTRRAEQQAKTQGRAGSEKSGGNGTSSDGNRSLASKLAGKKKLSDRLSTAAKGSSTGLTSEGYLPGY